MPRASQSLHSSRIFPEVFPLLLQELAAVFTLQITMLLSMLYVDSCCIFHTHTHTYTRCPHMIYQIHRLGVYKFHASLSDMSVLLSSVDACSFHPIHHPSIHKYSRLLGGRITHSLICICSIFSWSSELRCQTNSILLL